MMGKSLAAETQYPLIGESAMSLEKREALFLKYFPACGNSEDSDSSEQAGLESEAAKENDGAALIVLDEEKFCVYCGSIHVNLYRQREFFICEECRRQAMADRQDILEVVCQTYRDLEALLNIKIKEIPIVSHMNILRHVHSTFEIKKDKFGFRKDWVRVSKKNGKIEFSIHGFLPRSLIIFIAVLYFLDFFFAENEKLDQAIRLHTSLQKDALANWYGIHYMYLIGYSNFSKWQNKVWEKEEGYTQWCQLLGSPMVNCQLTVPGLLERLMEEKDA